MKVFYNNKIPKSRMRSSGQSGIVFDIPWTLLCEMVLAHRKKSGWTSGWDSMVDGKKIDSVFVTDEGVTFHYGD